MGKEIKYQSNRSTDIYQVLLCCSHVFHRVCVRAFERFSGRKCCPVCRKSEYDTRVIQDGARLFREQSATRIQACWRGFAARRSYRILRRSFPPKDKCLRRKFFEEKLQRLSDSLVRRCHGDVEAFLGDVDRSLAASRRLFQRLEGEERRGEGPGEGEWRRIQTQVLQRDGWDCSICLAPVCGPHARPRPPAPRRPALLLSCSHLFHRRCLEAFEAFQASGAGRAPRCPLCRSEYHKKVLALED